MGDRKKYNIPEVNWFCKFYITISCYLYDVITSQDDQNMSHN